VLLTPSSLPVWNLLSVMDSQCLRYLSRKLVTRPIRVHRPHCALTAFAMLGHIILSILISWRGSATMNPTQNGPDPETTQQPTSKTPDIPTVADVVETWNNAQHAPAKSHPWMLP
jgi:hypothetical protein